MMKSNSFRFNLHELGGALGDLGILLPLTVALITLNHMNATSVFLVVGLAYIVAGVFYRLPMPVQPLKAVAAISIAAGLSPSVISASGLLMAAFLLMLAGTGAIRHVAKLFPKAIIRGIQLGVGLILLKTGLLLVTKKQVIIGGTDGLTTMVNLSIPTGLLIALALGAIFVLFLRSKRLPASLALLAIGVAVGIFWGSFLGLPSLRFGLSLPALAIPSMADLSAALVLLVVPQIPLTLGNAVFAMRDTAKTYFGPQAKRVTPKALLTTMGVMNLGAGLFGGMPICHGSGGMTAHFRLGARTGGAALLIGIPFLAMAIFLDGNILPLLSLVPYAVLGVLVIFVGVQHSLLVKDLKGKSEILVALAVAVSGLITANLAIGLASGVCLHWLLIFISRSRPVWPHLASMARQKARLTQDLPGKASPFISAAPHITSSKRTSW
jgi:SulP family sulfate permease